MQKVRSRRFSLAAVAVGAGAATGVGVLVPATASAAVKTLTVDGSAPGCGTAAGSAVYCTIVAGVKNAAAGDTVVVNPGTYVGGAAVKASNVTITANGAVTIKGGPHAFTVDGFSNVTIQGFAITNTTGNAFVLGDGTGTAASHLTTDGLRILNNTVTGAGGGLAGPQAAGTVTAQGISAYYVTGSTFSGNRLDQNNDHGLYLAAGSNGNTVTGNEASWNWKPGSVRHANGINVVGSGNMVTGNFLHDNQDSGLQFYAGGDHGIAVNNVVWHNGDHGIDNLNTVGGVLVNNTVVDNCDAGINVEGALSSGYTVENNISVNNGTNTSCEHGPPGIGKNTDGNPGQPGQIRVADGAIGHTVEDHNLVFNAVNGVLEPGGVNWQPAGASDLVAAPGFAAAGTGDFHIGPGSPAAGKADGSAPSAPPVDADGHVRPTPASIGAFEGNAAPQTPKAVATITSTGYAPSAVVSVDASASKPGNLSTAPLSYLINFGDGTSAATSVAQHTYAAAGPYNITVTVTDGGGHQSTYSQQISVTAVPPTAALALTTPSGNAPVVVTADAGASKAFGGLTVAHYSFNFGDSSPPVTQTTPIATHNYVNGGPYTVVVTVWDSAGASGTLSKPISVAGTLAPPLPGPTPAPSPTPGPTPAPVGGLPVYQLGGTDRLATGVLVSRHRWDHGTANSVVLATGANFADALAGVPLAAKTGGPLLLVDGSSPTIRDDVMSEISRVLKPGGTVYILGGTAAVNAGVEHDLAAHGLTAVQRFAGANRYETSVKIAVQGLGSPAHAIVATGNGFADALAAGPLATGPAADSAGHPAAIILSNDTRLDQWASGYLAGKAGADITTVGRQAALAVPSAASQLWGGDRYATDAAVAAKFTGAAAGTQVGIANGANFPDALTGGAYMASLPTPGPIVLVDGANHAVPDQANAILASRTGITEGDIFGGTSVITPAMSTAIANGLHGAMSTGYKLF